MNVSLEKFDATKGLHRGRSLLTEVFWYGCKIIFFQTAFPWPSFLKSTLLRLFGAKVGIRLVIKPRVNIHFPWKLNIGDHVWIGEEVFILNLEPVTIRSNACISQRAFLCTGNHDYASPTMDYRNASIEIADQAWVGAQVFVGPGVKIGQGAVISAGSIVTHEMPAAMVCGGNPCQPRKKRWKQE